MIKQGEIIFSDLGSICVPKGNISNVRELNKWNSVPYRTAHYGGNMLVAMRNTRPDDVVLAPELKGYYRIFVGLPTYGVNHVKVRLSGEADWVEVAPSAQSGFGGHSVEDSFWRVADMTGQDIVIGKHKAGKATNAIIAWLRFEPMSDEEVAAWKADRARTDTKRIYATDDMHNRFGEFGPETPEEWHAVVKNYEDSDVEWLSMEDCFIYTGKPTTGSNESFSYCREFDESFMPRYEQHCTLDMYRDLVEYGHKQGLKMCTSMRMGPWGLEFPYDQLYYDNRFKNENKQLWCVDRDGSLIDAASYAYPETRKYMIDRFVEMASLGVDAVEMIYCRGIPYVLYEEPVLEMFRAKYPDVNPCVLPLDDPRINEIHCEIMTGFVRELREALDKAYPERKVGIHCRMLYSLYDSKYVGLDVERWAKEGLLTAIISYPSRTREKLEGDIWAEPGVIDLEKYSKYVSESEQLPLLHDGYGTVNPFPDSRGVPQGPKDQAERVTEIMRVGKENGVKVYVEIMPRHMPNLDFKAHAMELYGLGVDGVSLWDTFCRVPCRAMWSMAGRLGHKDELASYDSGKDEFYSYHRLLMIGGQDISRYIPAWGG